MALRRGLTAALPLAAGAGVLLAVLLVLSDPWAEPAAWSFRPAAPIDPLRSYLFRQAALNTLRLAAGTVLVTLVVGYVWARIAAPDRWGLWLGLAVWLLPGAVTGLLWRPLFPPTWYAQAESALPATGLVLVWRTAPLAALLLAARPRAWRLAAALPLWPALTDSGLILTLTGGEPFNASHTWASWLLTQLWVNRAWGHAAAMAGGLALVTTATLVGLFRPSRKNDVRLTLPADRRPGIILPALWLAAPLLPWLWLHGRDLGRGFAVLGSAGLALWWVSALLGFAWVLAVARHGRPGPGRSVLWRVLALAAWVVWPVSVAYLTAVTPWPVALLATYTLIGLTAAWTAAGHAPATLMLAGTFLAQSFPLLLVVHLPEYTYTPALGAVLRFGAAPDAAELIAALLLHYLIALAYAWLVSRQISGTSA